MIKNIILNGDCLSLLKTLPGDSVDCCVTSPPYYQLRDYGVEGQIGLEKTPEEYIEKLISVFNEVKRVLKDDGTLWVNIGDTYNGSGKNNGSEMNEKWKQSANAESHKTGRVELKNIPSKSLIGVPFRFALYMLNAGWTLRQDIIWAKPSCMPESVTDRFCKAHEYLFFFSKQNSYYFDHGKALEKASGYDGRGVFREVFYGEYEARVHNRDAAQTRERWPSRGCAEKTGETGLLPQYHGANIEITPLRLKRDVWTVTPEPSNIPHFAMFPQKLITPCIECGCPEGGIVLDPFIGSGTTAVVSKKLNRNYLGIEINPGYIKIAEERIADINPLFKEEAA